MNFHLKTICPDNAAALGYGHLFSIPELQWVVLLSIKEHTGDMTGTTVTRLRVGNPGEITDVL